MNEKNKYTITDVSKITPPENVPYIVYEGELARMERMIVRLWITIFVLIGVIVGGIVAFICYENQYETISCQQDGQGINNINTGEGDILNGAESYDKTEKEWKSEKDPSS